MTATGDRHTTQQPRFSPASPLWLVLIALLPVLPLWVHGPSCGHDASFHIESWLNAAAQLRHGHYPRWATTPAWNAGEPRFLFYPPLSWLVGAVLVLLLPAQSAPIAFLYLALLGAGLAMYRLARSGMRPHIALLAAALYLANPYTLFTALERSAFAELLAAVWMPLLLHALLAPRMRAHAIAVPLALLWITNAPAAVIGSYTLALVALLRLGFALRRSIATRPAAKPAAPDTATEQGPGSLALQAVGGAALGLALPAFYIIPAAIERRFVQVQMALVPDLSPAHNFLFARTADPAHDTVNHTVSLIALTLLLATVAALSAVLLRRPHPDDAAAPPVAPMLAFLTWAITLLLVPMSLPIWNHLPELAFLQFPWRWLMLLAVVAALALGLLLDLAERLPLQRATPLVAVLLTMALGWTSDHLFAQHCDATDAPATLAALLATRHGTLPTDEYTPAAADNDILRTDDPPFWLAPLNAPNTPAPHTTPTAAELDPTIDTDDTPVPLDQTVSTPAPQQLTLQVATPSVLVLHRRDYPNWQVTETDDGSPTQHHPAHIERNDGLLGIAVPAGQVHIELRWHTSLDQWLGLACSLLALPALWLLRPRAQKPQAATTTSSRPLP
jgi:hypothetical protein